MPIAHVLLCFAVIALIAPRPASAAPCSDPDGVEGEVVYNTTHKVAQFCNGTNWISMAAGASGGGSDSDTLADLSCATNEIPKWNGSVWICGADDGGTPAGSVAGAVQFRGASAVFAADDVNLVWDNTNKRLGIGTASPNVSLQVDHAGSAIALIVGDSTTISSDTGIYLRTTGKGYIMRANGGTISFRDASNNEHMVINGSGNVGIGIALPTSKLHVAGTAADIALSSNDTNVVGLLGSDSRSGSRQALYFNHDSNANYNDLYLGSAFELLDGVSNAVPTFRTAGSNSVNPNILGIGHNGFRFMTASGATVGTTFTPTEIMRVTSTGHVGIGTTTPGLEGTHSGTPKTLQIYAGVNNDTAAIKLGNNTPGGGNAIIELGAAGYLSADHWSWNPTFGVNLATRFNGTASEFYTPWTQVSRGYGGLSYDYNGGAHFYANQIATTAGAAVTPVERMTILPNGNVGIGAVGPSTLLHLASTVPLLTLTDTDTNADSQISASSGAGSLFVQADINNEAASSILGFYIDGSEKMRVTDTGNVGIGTTSPSARLEVSTTNSTGATALLSLNKDNSAAGTAALIWSSSGAYGFIDYDSASGQGVRFSGLGPLRFGSNTNATYGSSTFAEAMRITTAGNVGIGTTTPAQKLDVDGVVEIRGVAGGATLIGGRNNGANNFHIDAYNGSGTRGIYLNYFTGTGVYLAGGAVVTSDARKKKDIETLEGALSKIEQLRGVSYRWIDKDKDQSSQLGVIAQEVQSVYPELVKDDSYGFLSVNYEGFVAPLIEAVKELKAANDNQAYEIIELRREIEELKAAVH